MSEVIEILKKGLQTSVQGNYRYGYFGQGIPPSGPMDEYSHHIGNVLVGNKPDAASLEITMVGDKLVPERYCICNYRGKFQCQIK